MNDKRGLYGKYIVRKAKTGHAVEDCFVLRPGKDQAARAAIEAYIIATDNLQLATDLAEWLKELGEETHNHHGKQVEDLKGKHSEHWSALWKAKAKEEREWADELLAMLEEGAAHHLQTLLNKANSLRDMETQLVECREALFASKTRIGTALQEVQGWRHEYEIAVRNVDYWQKHYNALAEQLAECQEKLAADQWIFIEDEQPRPGEYVFGAMPLDDEAWTMCYGAWRPDNGVLVCEGHSWHVISHWMKPGIPERGAKEIER